MHRRRPRLPGSPTFFRVDSVYEGVQGPLRELKTRYPNPLIAGKIDEILAALAKAAPLGRE